MAENFKLGGVEIAPSYDSASAPVPQNKTIEEVAIQKEIAKNASLEDRTKGLADALNITNFTHKLELAYDLKGHFGEEDKAFRDGLTDYTAITSLQQKGIPVTDDNISYLRDAKNLNHYSDILNMLEDDKKKQENIDKSLTPLMQASAKFVSSVIFDPSILALPEALAAKTTKALIGTSLLYEGSRMGENIATGTQHESVGDSMIDLAKGAAINVAFFKSVDFALTALKGVPVNKLAEPIDSPMHDYKWRTEKDIPTNQTEPNFNNYTWSKTPNEIKIENEISKATQEFEQSLVTPVGESPSFVKNLDRQRQIEHNQFQEDMHELDRMIMVSNDFEKNIIPARYEEMNQYAKMREDAANYRQNILDKKLGMIEQEKQRIALDTEVKTARDMHLEDAKNTIENSTIIPEYMKKSIIRSIEDMKQPELKLAEKEAKLSELGSREKSINDELGKLNTKLESYKRESIHKSNTQAKIDNLKKELQNIRNTTKQIKSPSMNMDKAIKTAAIKQAEDNLMISGLMHNDIAKVVEEFKPLLTKENIGVWKELQPDIELLAKKYPNEFNALKQDVNNLLISNANVELKSKLLNKLPQSKKLAIALTVGAMGTTAANASDGSNNENVLGVASTVALSLIAGMVGLSVIRNSKLSTLFKGWGNILDATASNATWQVSKAGLSFERSRQAIVSFMRTELFEAYAPIARYGGKAKNIASKILHDPLSSGSKVVASTDKDNMLRASTFQIGVAIEQNMANYLRSIGVSVWDRATNRIALLDSMNNEIAKVIEGGYTNNPYLRKMADSFKARYEEIWNAMKEAGYDISKIKDYFPRVWKTDVVREMIRMNSANRQIIVDAFAKSIAAKNANLTAQQLQEEANNLVKQMFDTPKEGIAGFTLHDDVFSTLQTMLKQGVTEADVNAALTTKQKDMLRSMKYRKDLDMSAFENIEVLDANGSKVKVGLESFVDRNATRVYESYANAAYGHIAMAKQGYPTLHKFMKEVNGVRRAYGDAPADELVRLGNHIFGVAAERPNDVYTSMLNGVTVASMGLKLGTSAFSTATELFRVVFNSEIGRITNTIGRAAKSYNNNIMNEMIKIYPIGTSKIRGIMPERTYGSAIDQAILTNQIGSNKTFTNMLNQFGLSLVKFVVDKMGLGTMSDLIQRMNLEQSFSKLARHIELGRGLEANRLDIYGLDANTINSLKGVFTLDSKGEIVAIGGTKKQRETIASVMRNITNEKTPEGSISSIPALLDGSNPVGRMFAPLLRYSFASANTMGMVNVAKADKTAVWNFMVGTLGSYTSMKVKYALQNKDMDDRKLLYWAIMQNAELSGVEGLKTIFTGSNGKDLPQSTVDTALSTAMKGMQDLIKQTEGTNK